MAVNIEKRRARQRKADAVWYRKNKTKRFAANAAQAKRLRDAYQKIKTERGCYICGERRFPCLDFHHKDPTQKLFCVSRAIENGGMQKMLDEIEKCDVVCSNCHRVHHHNERNPDNQI